VGTSDGADEGAPFIAPTLAKVWRSAPYLHDGRAATIKELFTHHNKNDRHGATSKLTPRELKDLVEYIQVPLKISLR
jgi:cytochrome c peroxidase